MEVDGDGIEMTTKVFNGGVRSMHKLTVPATVTTVSELQKVVTDSLDLPLAKWSPGMANFNQTK